MKALIITAIVVGLSITIIYITLYLQKKRIKDILTNPAYAIGEIRNYVQKNGYERSIHYTFSVEQKQYYNWVFTNFNNASTIKKGDKFIVVYQKDNPKSCVLDFNYPVKENSDYNNYLAKFKIFPPEFGVLKIGTSG